MGHVREVLAVIVAADSPLGRVSQAVDDLAAHLPPPDQPRACPLCSAQSWPCAGFDDAAHRALVAGLRLSDLVPLDLHERLWPRKRPQAPSTSPQDTGSWFDQKEQDR